MYIYEANVGDEFFGELIGLALSKYDKKRKKKKAEEEEYEANRYKYYEDLDNTGNEWDEANNLLPLPPQSQILDKDSQLLKLVNNINELKNAITDMYKNIPDEGHMYPDVQKRYYEFVVKLMSELVKKLSELDNYDDVVGFSPKVASIAMKNNLNDIIKEFSIAEPNGDVSDIEDGDNINPTDSDNYEEIMQKKLENLSEGQYKRKLNRDAKIIKAELEFAKKRPDLFKGDVDKLLKFAIIEVLHKELLDDNEEMTKQDALEYTRDRVDKEFEDEFSLLFYVLGRDQEHFDKLDKYLGL